MTSNVKTLLSFSGCAGAYPVHFGVVKRLLEITKNYPNHEFLYAGVSAGCMPALALALGFNAKEIDETFERFVNSFDRFWKTRYTHFYSNMEQSILSVLGPNSYKDVSGRVLISLTRVTPFGLKNELISEFHSNQDLVDAIITSSHLPFLWARPPVKKFRNFWALDGGISNNLVHLEGANNICFDLLDHPIQIADFFIKVCPSKWQRLSQYGYESVDAALIHSRLQQVQPSPPVNCLVRDPFMNASAVNA